MKSGDSVVSIKGNLAEVLNLGFWNLQRTHTVGKTDVVEPLRLDKQDHGHLAFLPVLLDELGHFLAMLGEGRIPVPSFDLLAVHVHQGRVCVVEHVQVGGISVLVNEWSHVEQLVFSVAKGVSDDQEYVRTGTELHIFLRCPGPVSDVCNYQFALHPHPLAVSNKSPCVNASPEPITFFRLEVLLAVCI